MDDWSCLGLRHTRSEASSYSENVARAASALNKNGGVYRDRTDDILLAKQALSQLS